ncbi:MAG: AEC family transporter [Lachnospiraceae bacterium]|nr:AEC family transporter [Lachnospiraceae bacterium]
MFILIVHQLIVMMFIMIVGFLAYRLHVVSQEGNKVCSNILLLVVNPALIITVYQMDFDIEMARLLGIAFIASILSHCLAILAVHLLIPKKKNPEYVLDRFSAVYSNCAFIGIPLIQATIGPIGVFFLSAYIATFNLFMWTHGVATLKGSFSMKTLKTGIISPVFLATILAVLLFFLQITLPELVVRPMEFLAAMTTPLAMLIAGFSIAQADLKKVFLKFNIYRACFVKSIVIPLATLVLFLIYPVDTNVAYAILIAAACPTAVAGTMMAMRYNKNYAYASELFSVNTIIAVITIPLIVFIAELVL